jgi:hypothetical protein
MLTSFGKVELDANETLVPYGYLFDDVLVDSLARGIERNVECEGASVCDDLKVSRRNRAVGRVIDAGYSPNR